MEKQQNVLHDYIPGGTGKSPYPDGTKREEFDFTYHITGKHTKKNLCTAIMDSFNTLHLGNLASHFKSSNYYDYTNKSDSHLE